MIKKIFFNYLFIVHLPPLLFSKIKKFFLIKIKEHCTLKTTIYDIIMFQQTIFVILTKSFIYALHTYLSHTASVARDSIEDKYSSSV